MAHATPTTAWVQLGYYSDIDVSMPSPCVATGPATQHCTSGWLAPSLPNLDLLGPRGSAARVDDHGTPYTGDDTQSPLHIAGGAYDLDGDGSFETPATVAQSYGSSYSDPFSASSFTLGGVGVLPVTLAPSRTISARAQADGGTAGTATYTVGTPARRVYVSWDNGAKVDVHVWQADPTSSDPRLAAHAYYGASYDLPNASLVGTVDQAVTPLGATPNGTGLAAGVGPYALVDYPSASWDAAQSTLTYTRTGGYTVGICQYAGSGATVTVQLTNNDGTVQTVSKTLANTKDAWLAGTTDGAAPVLQTGWCNGNEPTSAGATSAPATTTVTQTVTVDRPVVVPPAVPKGSLAKTKVKHGKTLALSFTNVPKGAVVTVLWKKGKKRTSTFVVVKNGASIKLKAPKAKGAYTLQVTYLGVNLVGKKVTVTK